MPYWRGPTPPHRMRILHVMNLARRPRREPWLGAGHLEPIAAVGDPPTSHANRDRSSESPPEWQCQVGDQTTHRERHPKNFALHANILAANARSIGGALRWSVCEP